MIGLSCSVASRDPIRPCFNGTLPYNGSYIYLESAFKYSDPDGATSPVSIHDYDNISFDDTTIEAYDFEGNLGNVYNESGSGGKHASSVYFSQNDTVTITGNITRLDNGQVWDNDDTSNNGYILFTFNGTTADNCKVYIDIQNSSSITASNVDKVSSDGSFQVSRQITDALGVKWFQIVAEYIEYQGGHSAADEPRVRISNLRMTKS